MADNVDITAGSGTTIGTDQVGTTHYQQVKIMDGTLNSSTPVPGGASGLAVDIKGANATLNVAITDASVTVDVGTALPAGDNNIGNVDLASAIPAGTNAIGKLAANSGVDIGDVDVTSVVPGTGATSLGKAQDTAAGATDTGIAMLAKRDDALGGLTPVAGDYAICLVDANGALWVRGSGTFTVDGSGVTQPISAASLPLPSGAATSANQTTAISNLTAIAGNTSSLAAAVSGSEMQVDVVASLPAGTNYMGNVRITDGTTDATVRNLAANDALNVAIVDGAGNQVTSFGGSGGTSSTDDAAFTAGSGSGTPMMGFATSDVVDAGDVGVVAMDVNRNLKVSLEAGNTTLNVAVTDSNITVNVNNTVTVDLGANNDVTATGNVAHDAADSGNPLKIGGKARTANPTAVANNDRVDAFFDDVGRQVVRLSGPRDLEVQGSISLTTTSETTILAAGGASTYVDLTLLTISNGGSTGVTVKIREKAGATTPIFQFYAAADGGGAVLPFPVSLNQTTANTAWTAELSAAISTVYVTAQGVKNV